jgi:hypothetical protein
LPISNWPFSAFYDNGEIKDDPFNDAFASSFLLPFDPADRLFKSSNNGSAFRKLSKYRLAVAPVTQLSGAIDEIWGQRRIAE